MAQGLDRDKLEGAIAISCAIRGKQYEDRDHTLTIVGEPKFKYLFTADGEIKSIIRNGRASDLLETGLRCFGQEARDYLLALASLHFQARKETVMCEEDAKVLLDAARKLRAAASSLIVATKGDCEENTKPAMERAVNLMIDAQEQIMKYFYPSKEERP